MIDLDLIARGFAEYPIYGYIAFASLIMNYFTFGFIFAQAATPEVEKKVDKIMSQNIVITAVLLLWPIFFFILNACLILLAILSFIASLSGKTDGIKITGFFGKK